MNERIREKIIEICLKIARIAAKGEGALIIYGNLPPDSYEPMIDQNIISFSIEENPKLFEKLALIDGAILVNKGGYVYAFGVRIKSGGIFRNYGTRHAAGLSASLHKEIEAFVVSDEDRKVRIFKNGVIALQLDALEKDIEKNIPKATSFLDDLGQSVGVGALGAIGASMITSTPIGVIMVPGIIVFGSAYHIIRKLMENEKMSKMIKG